MHRFRARLLTAGVIAGFAGSLGLFAGCSPRQTVRPQAADDLDRDTATATVGAKTAVGNYDAIPVSGVGLVYDLKGTGSNPPSGEWRKMLETALRKQKFSGDQVKQFLDDPEKSTSLVMVSAVIPRGSRQGDKLDLVVTLPPGSRTTSLAGGRLHDCDLTNYELAGAVRQSLTASGIPTGNLPVSAGQLVTGNRMATAQGPLVAGTVVAADTKATDANPTVAKVWGGATGLIDRPYYFLLNDSARQPQLAMAIAARLNTVFHGTTDRGVKVAEAKVQQRPMVLVNVPPAYRLNHDRFLLVARQVPLVPPAANDPARERLKQDLLRPETAIVAGVKLEALGASAEDILRIGLEHEHAPWVRFAAAQSLVYLGKANGQVAAELGRLAIAHPAIRSHCLTALASQDDSPCLEQLAELMRKGDPDLRYGAFAALRAANDSHEAVRTRPLPGSPYALHMVASDSDPLIHLSTDKRNEIVLFGTVWPILNKCSLPLGTEYTVSVAADGGPVRIARVYIKDGEATTVETTCRADVAAVLKGLAELGGGYSEAVELVRRLHAGELLAAKVAVDAHPQGLNIQKLALIARGDPTLSRADQEAERVMKDGGGMTGGGYDLPAEAEGVRRVTGPDAAKPDGRSLNRNPGSLIGR